jgi:hypothetical protein
MDIRDDCSGCIFNSSGHSEGASSSSDEGKECVPNSCNPQQGSHTDPDRLAILGVTGSIEDLPGG